MKWEEKPMGPMLSHRAYFQVIVSAELSDLKPGKGKLPDVVRHTGAIRAPGSFRKKWSFPQVLIGFNTILWSNDLDDLGVPPFYTTTICIYITIYCYVLLNIHLYGFCLVSNAFCWTTLVGWYQLFLAICCRALTPQASHSFLGFMTYMSVLVGQINM